VIVALAGRRVDPASDDKPRFPLSNVAIVRARLFEALQQPGISTLVSSAACGADLLALEVARAMGLRCRVILPFAPHRFCESSVTDRSGEWGPMFDDVVAAAGGRGDLVVLDLDASDADEAYRATNRRILDEAQVLAGGAEVRAIVVWDGVRRGQVDMTADFLEEAGRRGIPVSVVSTL
jgi:hypothetical protein